MSEFPPRYEPEGVEQKWYKEWQKRGLFTPKVPPEKPVFSISIPPPNVTGNLTIGHMLDNTFQDIIVRYKKLRGYEVMWLPGMDHAGIATQVKIEKKILEQKKSKEKMGREDFLKIAWKWKEDYAQTIRNQLKRLGCALDWSRERFTLDEGLSKAVRLVFVKLYDKGLIYRGRYMVNWCPRCRTALANEQVEREEEDGALYYISYPIDSGGEIMVATTRPETMLGDTGVAVNPDDERFKKFKGKTVTLPIVGRKIPIIADGYVDPEFGTGAVKVTPAHDAADLMIGRRHDLKQVEVIDEDGRMTEEAGRYEGLERFQCRKKLIEDLKKGGYLKKVEDYRIPIGRCERCETIVEPRISLQWFVKMKPLIKHGRHVLDNKEIEVYPPRWVNLFRHWIENIEDWCISRQLWWGHPIPVWYCQDCDEIIVSEKDPESCNCGSTNLIQDEDVLDTWFSSWLWPFSTLGWPEETKDLEFFYPNSMVVSGWDILFNWILRMIVAGYEFTDERPFKDILFHGLIRDRYGRKMSKSLGNSPEPIDLLDKYGADGLRMGLLLITPKEQDILFAEDYIVTGRNFVNKLWNAARMVSLRYPDLKAEINLSDPFDHWIVAKFNNTIEEIERAFTNYQINSYTKIIYDFVWHTFCDKYLEHLKYSQPYKGELAKFLLGGILRFAHPVIPFVTEEIWHRFNFADKSIMFSRWPDQIECELRYPVDNFFDLVSAINRTRSEWDIHPKNKIDLYIKYKDKSFEKLLRDFSPLLTQMSNLKSIKFNAEPKDKAIPSISSKYEAYIPLADIIDFKKEEERLREEEKTIEGLIDKIEDRLSDKQFLKKAPPEVVEREKKRLSEFKQKFDSIERCLEILAG